MLANVAEHLHARTPAVEVELTQAACTPCARRKATGELDWPSAKEGALGRPRRALPFYPVPEKGGSTGYLPGWGPPRSNDLNSDNQVRKKGRETADESENLGEQKRAFALPRPDLRDRNLANYQIFRRDLRLLSVTGSHSVKRLVCTSDE